MFFRCVSQPASITKTSGETTQEVSRDSEVEVALKKAISGSLGHFRKVYSGFQNLVLNLKRDGKTEFKSTPVVKKSGAKPNSRMSVYRGSSKNGGKFQVIIMIGGVKRFIGVYDSEETAAKVYDQISLVFHNKK